MQNYQNTVQNSSGAVVPGATITVYTAGTSSKPTIYSDNGITALANPFPASGIGFFKFYAANGRYDVNISGSGVITQTISDIILSDGSIPTITTATFTEEAAPSGVASSDILWGDSTAHRLKMNNNNGGADVIVGAATTDTLTHKTFDTAGVGNSLAIGGVGITTTTGSGSQVVLSTSPIIATPSLTGNTSVGLISSYNGIPTVKNGVPSLVATTDLSAAGGGTDIAATTLYTNPNTSTQLYRLTFVQEVTATDASGASYTINILFTSQDSGNANTWTAGSALTVAALGAHVTGTIVLLPTANSAIQYSSSHTGSPTTSRYSVHFRLEAI